MELTDNFINDDGVAPIRAYGTRWTGYLVKAFQRAINKFGIYLADLENFDKKGGSENKGRNFWLCQQMARLWIPNWDRIFSHLLMPLSWQKNIVTAAD